MAKAVKSPHFPNALPSSRPKPTGITKIQLRKSPISKSPSSVTPFQLSVYAHLLCIPPGSLMTYGSLAKALNSAPRAVGGALRSNPFAPTVPCHRVIASDGFIGGFKGDWEKAPSGVNQILKLKLLKEEGVEFSKEGKLMVREGVWFEGPWDGREVGEARKRVEGMMKGDEKV